MAIFAVAVTLGGANFVAVRFSNRELEPFWGAGLRFSLAALLFVAIAVGLRLEWPRGRQLALNIVYGLLSFAVSYALMYWALVRVTAGIATVVLASVPLVTLLLAAAHRLEKLRARAVVGSLLAVAGIVWMAAGPEEVVLPFAALAAMIAAALSIGESVIISKRISVNHPAMINAVGMTSGALALLALSAVSGETWALPRQAEAVWSVIYLVAFGSVGLFVLVLLVVRQWTASATSYMFVLFPVVAMVLGTLLGDDKITIQSMVGALLVMVAVWFGALSPTARQPLVPTRGEAAPVESS
ncbi:EamA family transporter [soil metagenome]